MKNRSTKAFKSAGVFTLAMAIQLASTNVLAVNNSDYSLLKDANKPFSLKQGLTQSVPVLTLPNLNLSELNQQDSQKLSADNSATRFAIPYTAKSNYADEGKWIIEGETAIWRLKVKADTAKSLNFGFKNVFFPKGTQFFIYSNESPTNKSDDVTRRVIGPYSDADNKPHRQLWTPIIKTQEATIEINVPVAVKPYLAFDLATINQGYKDLETPFESNKAALLPGCGNDVVCSVGDPWRKEIRSVARYTISGSQMCTGQLLNNVKQDSKPYFLTANHCGNFSSSSASMVFYWNYESSVCGGTQDGQFNQSTSGATFRADYDRSGGGSDFALVEIDSIPDQSYNVHWAGWDNTPIAPSSGTVIHHSEGKEKQISFDNDPLTRTSDRSDTENPNGPFIRIASWDNGSIHGGASGSGIWNSAHRLVGTYTGGRANCTTPNEASWFGGFSTHWTGDGNANGQLKAWLDPDDTGAVTLDGKDGSSSCSAISAAITFSANPAQLEQNVQFGATVSGGAGGFSYSWDLDGDTQEDSTASNPSFAYPYFFQNNISLTVTDSDGCSESTSSALVVTNSGSEIFMANGALPGNFVQPTGTDASWAAENSETFEGSFSLKANTIDHSQTAGIEVTQNFTASSGNFVGFVVKTSTEANSDSLLFYIDNNLQDSWSGNTEWQTVHYDLSQGTHTLKWVYQKDGSATSGSDNVWIDGVTGVDFTSNSPPTAAVAQSSITAETNSTVTLDASASSDPENQTLSFNWTQVSGPSTTITNANAAQASFLSPASATTIVVRVTVSDPAGSTDTADVTITVNEATNLPPTAAVTQSSITSGISSNVALDATPSSDPENQNLSFNWTQVSGPAVSINNANAAQANFTSPATQANIVLRVTVSDPAGNSDSTNITVTVTDAADLPPTAAVVHTNISATANATVTLDASPSSDPEGLDLTYNWTQVSGTNVTLNNSTSVQASFTTPNTNGDLIFRVTVADPAANSNSIDVTVNVLGNTNQSPTAAVSQSSITVNEGGSVTLDGSSSSDPEGQNLTFSWAQVSGTTVSISNGNSSTASFVAPQVNANSNLVFMLTVTDSEGATDSINVTVSVTDQPDTTSSSSSGGGGSLGYLLVLALLGSTRLSRKKL